MLVLSRQKDESIVLTIPPSPVERKVEIKIVELKGEFHSRADKTRVFQRKVKLGVIAGKDILVLRNEVKNRYEVAEKEINNEQEG